MPIVESLRFHLREQIYRVITARPDEIVAVAYQVLLSISTTRFRPDKKTRTGPAATTRWLALARPDYLVSVNGASVPGLDAAANLPQNHPALAKKYDTLLKWTHGQEWFSEVGVTELSVPLELEIWNNRVALVGVFVYPV